MLYIWYPKNGTDLNTIHEENDVIETSEELVNVKKQLKLGKCTCLIMRMEHPRAYGIRCNKTVTRLLSALLSRDYSTSVKRIPDSCQQNITK